MTRDELLKNIDTIVVVMMENRSFDHVFGHLRHPKYGNNPGVDGIEDLNNPKYVNPNSDGEAIRPFWRKDAPYGSDLPHDKEAVSQQLAYAATNGSYLMNGFVRAFEDEFHTVVDDPPVMGLLPPEGIPTTGALATQYTLCDRWFACIPTSTAPNRLMSMCGYTDIAETGTSLPNQQTVYDWLTEHGVSWRVYSAGLPFLTLMPRLAPLLLSSHFRRIGDLQKDIQSSSSWPQVIFIEPDYYDCPIHFEPPCDNHAPLAMAPGEAFLARVYKTLTSNPARWSKTALFITYDEHGGFFDHVPPLPVKYRNPNGTVSFDSTGPRVPTIVAGPFAPAGVCHLPLDNTSILMLLAERFGAPGEFYSPTVHGRAPSISSASAVLSVSAANTGVLAIPASGLPTSEAGLPLNQNALRDAFQTATGDLLRRHPLEVIEKYPELGSKNE